MNPSPKMPASGQRPASLAVWMTVSVLVFVLLGSLALVLAFERHLDREERRAFEGLARTNADFLARTRLPQTETMAAQLGEIIGAQVFFWDPATERLIGKAGPHAESRRFHSNMRWQGQPDAPGRMAGRFARTRRNPGDLPASDRSSGAGDGET